MFTVTQVGSWPRSRDLLRALREKQAGRLPRADFERLADGEVRRCVEAQIEAGVDLLVDGEQRRDNFYSFITDKLDGTRLMSLAEMLDTVEDKSGFEEMLATLDVPASAIKQPDLRGPARAARAARRGRAALPAQLTDKPVKITLPGPYLLTRAMWVGAFTQGPLRRQAGDGRGRGAHPARGAGRSRAPPAATFVQFDEPVLTEIVFSEECDRRTFM